MPNNTVREPLEWLALLAREYRHVQQEHQREAPAGATRRRLEHTMQRLATRFERLVGQWVRDETAAAAWRSHFYEGGAAPATPALATPPLFRGRTDANAILEIRAAADGGYDILVGDAVLLHETVPWRLDPDLHGPIQVHGYRCDEVFAAPDEAVAALARFVGAAGGEPPWPWARALYEDGLVGADFQLTPRGERRLGPPSRPTAPPTRPRYGVLAADAARARIFLLDTPEEASEPPELVEIASATNPERRARDSELLSEPRPGLRREGPTGPRHATDDHRDRRRKAVDQRFAEAVLAEATQRWRDAHVTRVVVVASPAMLGHLRAVLAHEPGPRRLDTAELARDLTHLATPALHDALASEGVLPPRFRRPPLAPPLPGTPATG